MSEMVERVAKAMQQRAKEPLYNIKSLEPVLVGSLGDAWECLARAAIEAMREPIDNQRTMFEPTVNQIKTAFRVAINMLSIYEPPDSRAVSDIFVALASVDAGNINQKTIDIINEKVNKQTESGADFSDLK